jgi:HK97 family phage portal protein
MSDFMLNTTRQLYLDGNAYALALRNDRYEVSELHLMDSRFCRPQLAVNGEVFYRLHGNQVIEKQLGEPPIVVPMRDVLHVRLHVDRTRRYPFPLWGQTPLLAAMDDVTVSGTITSQQVQFYNNQARPSSVLSTDMVLDKDQVSALRDRWDEQSKGLAQGKTPILTAGLKVQPWAATAKDAQLAEMMKMSEEHIAIAYRVPLQIMGLGTHTFRSTEALMQFWIATGLGFALNHIEEAFGILFMLKGQPDEYVEFDTSALLRSAYKDRIEALARGVQGGIYSPNEARNQEGLDDVKFGDEPRVQQQVVPLSAAEKIGPTSSGPHPPPAPPAPSAPAAPSSPAIGPPKKAYRDDVQREIRGLFATADRIGRNRLRS